MTSILEFFEIHVWQAVPFSACSTDFGTENVPFLESVPGQTLEWIPKRDSFIPKSGLTVSAWQVCILEKKAYIRLSILKEIRNGTNDTLLFIFH